MATDAVVDGVCQRTGDSSKGDGDVRLDVQAEKQEMRTEQESRKVIYGVTDWPPFYTWPVYGLQQAFMCVAGGLSVPFIISSYICAGQLPEVRAQLLSITFFMCGVATLLQTTLGIRLPIIQGASSTFLLPIAAMMQLDKWRCPEPDQVQPGDEEAWLVRIREIQGNLLLASVTQVVLGSTGLVGQLLRFIGPVTIAPTIAFIGLGLTSVVVDYAQYHWGVSGLTACLVLVFSLWLGRLQVPVLSWNREQGCHTSRFPIFIVISVLLAVGCGWLFCYILTVAGALPNNSTLPAYRARTDINLAVLDQVPWFRFPYPFQFGLPTVSIAGFFGLFMATMSSILESVGDYYACARVSGAPPPPPHAVNRGIAIEGFSSIISGFVGASHATTSYSGNIAAIAVTQVASRPVFQVAGLILVLLGVLTKVCAVITLIPEPVIGGLNAVLLGTLIAVGMATLSYVDMTSPRNVTILGVTFMLGMAIPQWVNAEPGRINTGDEKADQVLMVLLSTPMFVGSILGATLDNLAPGSPEERGIARWQKDLSANGDDITDDQKKEQEAAVQKIYDLPFISGWLRRVHCCRFVPFLPSFNGFFATKPKSDTKKTSNGASAQTYVNATFKPDADSDTRF